MITRESLPIPAASIIGQQVEQEAVLVLPEHGQVKVLNESGARIWELIDGHRSVQEIVAIIHQEFDAELSQVECDTLAFLQELADRRMVSFATSETIAD